jgi:EpsI family protein
MMTLRRHPFLVSIAFLVIVAIIAFPIAWGSDVVVVKVNLDQLPRRILGLEGRDERIDESIYRILNADYHILREYRGASGRSVWLYIGYYGTAKGGRPSHVPQSCYTGQGFSIVEWTKVPAAGGGHGMLNKMHVKRGNIHQVVLFWYQSKDKILADGIQQNLHRFKNRLLYNRDDGALLRLSTDMNPDNEVQALALLQEFAGQLLKLLPGHWPEESKAPTHQTG